MGSANTKVYVNGAYKNSDDETNDNTSENRVWQIGAHGNSAYEWVGDVDEVRLYKETLSADWIKFEYRNIAEADNELTWAAEEQAPESSPPSELIGNPYMFTGRRFDLETGLYYYRARYYNPYIGRFLQTDPIGYSDGINWYNYCGSNPLNYLDPTGLIKVAFYDPEFENYNEDRFPDTPNQMKKWADDDYFDMSFPMTSFDDVVDKLNELKEQGIDVTEVYIYDHAGYDYGPYNEKIYGAQFGKDWLDVVTRNDYKWAALGAAAPNATFHFRGCTLGAVVSELAVLIGRPVTAVNGKLWNSPQENGPNYYFNGDLLMATPLPFGKTKVQTLWSNYITEIIMYEPYVVVIDGWPHIELRPVYVTYKNPNRSRLY